MTIETDEELEIGIFGIATKMAKSPETSPRPPAPAPVETVAVSSEEVAGSGLRYALVYPGGRYPLREQPVVLGRARECDIHLPDPNVSRRHAEIRPDGEHYVIVDLDSTNGTEVNGRRVKQARLANGDLISVGQTELKFTQE